MSSHTLSLLAVNNPGVLNRVTSLLRRRQFNIESLTAGHSERPGVSRIVVVLAAGSRVEQAVRQLEKLIDVLEARELPDSAVVRDLALITVKLPATAAAVRELITKTNAQIVRKTKDACTLQAVGTVAEIDTLLRAAKKLPLAEVSRSGAAAVS